MPSEESTVDIYKAALDKAQEKQAQSNSESSAPAKNQKSDSLQSDISYNQTKIIAASTPHLERGRILNSAMEGWETDAFRMLRTQILQRMRARDARTLAVCSANDGAGKTFIGINLALILAKDVNHTVMLVDLDLRRPRINKYFNLEDGDGLIDVLSGEASLSNCLVNPGVDRLVILPNYNPVRNSSELLSSPQMAKFATELRERYQERIIIYDLPPILQVDDSIAFIDHIDAWLFVVEEGVTKSEEISEAIHLIGEDKLIGTVLNKSKQSFLKNKYIHY